MSMLINMSAMLALRWPNMASAASTMVVFIGTLSGLLLLAVDELTLEVTDMVMEPLLGTTAPLGAGPEVGSAPAGSTQVLL